MKPAATFTYASATGGPLRLEIDGDGKQEVLNGTLRGNDG